MYEKLMYICKRRIIFMLTPKQNLLETLKPDGKPDRLVNQYEPFVPIMVDPLQKYTRGNRVRGKTSIDRWGTEILFPEDAPGPMPHVTEENKVCPDVTEWEKYVKVPDLAANCTDGWEEALEAAANVDRDQYLTMGFMGTGVFEQSHFLMGFEDTLVNFLLEPDDMKALVAAIAEYRFQYTKMLVDNLKPDVILSHDDWGAKHSMFMDPDTWREFFKDHYRRIYGYMKDHGVIVMHHADSFLEPIVEDMADIGIDIWQGVLPENDIPAIQKKLNGRMTLMGGLNSGIDQVDSSEETIRSNVRKTCEAYGPGGHFIPCMTYGLSGTIYPHVDPIVKDEIDRYNEDTYK